MEKRNLGNSDLTVSVESVEIVVGTLTRVEGNRDTGRLQFQRVAVAPNGIRTAYT